MLEVIKSALWAAKPAAGLIVTAQDEDRGAPDANPVAFSVVIRERLLGATDDVQCAFSQFLEVVILGHVHIV